jgi:Ni,Fe-hydrogenase maturation factor
MNIYVMGNLLINYDSLPIKLLPLLQKEFPDIEFSELDPTEDIPPQKRLIIIDTVINIKKIMLFNDIDKIDLGRIVSLHDFDLGYNLKLMKKFGMVDKVNIIGVPPKISQNKAILEIKKLINKIKAN